LRGENRNTGRETCLSATYLNSKLHWEKKGEFFLICYKNLVKFNIGNTLVKFATKVINKSIPVFYFARISNLIIYTSCIRSKMYYTNILILVYMICVIRIIFISNFV